ncbi:MAG: chemotaxis protein CheW [Thermaerobacter sp.]|nr:chemotaxis protein CheW [Thermaerobacter sp.]
MNEALVPQAQAAVEVVDAGPEEQVVAFQLADETYGVDIGSIREIITWQRVTPVPGAQGHIEGIINLRGRVIPVVDLRRRLGLPPIPDLTNSKIVIVEHAGDTIGLVVDGVSEVLRVPTGAVEPPSRMVSDVSTDYLRGVAKVGDNLVILLSLDRALVKSAEETERLGGGI